MPVLGSGVMPPGGDLEYVTRRAFIPEMAVRWSSSGWSDYSGTHVFPPKLFPRSGAKQDEIMVRRYEVRRKLKLRHWTMVTLVIVFAPVASVAVLRLWWFAMKWLAL
jgi:hypothetical protein